MRIGEIAPAHRPHHCDTPRRQFAGVGHFGRIDKFLARHSASRVPKRDDKPQIRFRMSEHRLEQPPEFRHEFAGWREIQTIEVLGERKALVEKTPIVWNPAKYHIGLNKFATAHYEPRFPGIRFAVMQRKRLKIDSPRSTVE